MKRLTEKYDINYKIKGLSIEKMDALFGALEDNGLDYNLLANVLHKIGKLEDIEQELGIDLIELFKKEHKNFHQIEKQCGNSVITETIEYKMSSSFGLHTTVVLTKEELEK